MTDIIEDGDGRLFEVVEGTLTQNERYVLQWQDIEADIAALEAQGSTRADALTTALAAVGRKSVFVRRIPNSADPGPSDGISRVYCWNTDGDAARPGFLVRALERPSVGFYERRLSGANARRGAADVAHAQADAALATANATLDAAVTLPAYRAAVDAGVVETRVRALAAIEEIETAQRQADDAINGATDALSALAALPPSDVGHSVEVIEAKIAETRAAHI